MSKFFIRRPIVAMVIAILMVIAGVISMMQLPTAQFPQIAPPEIQVKTSYTGADAETVSQSVATPIEQQMSGVDHMNYMSSVNSGNGSMTLTVDFDMKSDPNTDQMLTQLRTTQANSQLPSAVITNGVTAKKSMSLRRDKSDGSHFRRAKKQQMACGPEARRAYLKEACPEWRFAGQEAEHRPAYSAKTRLVPAG